MEKLSKKHEDGICKLLHHIHNEDVIQHILETLGKENWTRDILMECSYEHLTEEQAKAADLNADGIYNAFDLAALKNLYLSK